MEAEIHEFYLKGYPQQVYRVGLGELMPAERRETFPTTNYFDKTNQTGSLGFMDIGVRTRMVPVEYEGNHSSREKERRRVLAVLVIGIEPDYMRRALATQLVARAEKIAEEWDLSEVLIDTITNPNATGLARKLGYILYNCDTYGIKNVAKARTILT